MLVYVVRITVQHGVHGCLANSHGDVGNRVFVEPGPLRNLLGSQFNLVNAVQRRI